jgi:hypothetical protein
MNQIILRICLVIYFTASFLNAQISPGELTTAHQNLEGLSNCTKCHDLGDKVTNSNCLACHTEIRSLMNLGNGYHSSGDVKGKDCSQCHPEHFGRNFKIINFDSKTFNHDKTSYKLIDAHTKIDCDKCHQVKNISDPKLKKRGGTYLGLNSYCFSCHTDYHQKTLGDDCGKCHNTEKFKPAVKFDHSKARYKLTGKHLETTCIKCHPVIKKEGVDFQKFTGLQFDNCSLCHKDIHQGKFGKDCNNCHVTTGFSVINKKGFDHSKTNYPLLGKHSLVNCDKCHKTGIKEKPEFKKCINCHSDYHKGQFVTGNLLQDCKECHSEYGFKPANFTIKRHNQNKFQLTGAHLATPCEKCHLDNENWKFRKLGSICIDCHNNVHGSEIIEKYLNGNNCTECHVTENWSTINFDHKRTEFELLGKHTEQKCRLCHYQKIPTGEQSLFKSLGKNCEVCHKDVHAGQFKEGEISECTKCHTYDNWKPDTFDHEKTRFKLKGAHEKLKCNQCHHVVESANIKFIKYKLEDFKCSDCHK